LRCVAWLTATPILEALSEVETAIVVQKEDFLRRDQGQTDSWRQTLRKSYGAITNGFARYQFPYPFGMMNYAGDPTVDPVSCVGNHNTDKRAAMPRMHHKFLVRGAQTDDGFVPSAVWTGSFNFSKNGGNSFENAVEIHDVDVAQQYLNEFARVAALSEPLNWSRDWVTPQYRLGS
jgi:phosphatidylserine/phosphatidylglycerophosphate/cardiolipin synthase-like enzyme